MTSVYTLYYEYDNDDDDYNLFRIAFQTFDKELCVKQALYQANKDYCNTDYNPDRFWCVGETIIHTPQTSNCEFYNITKVQGNTFSSKPNFQKDQSLIYLVYVDMDRLPIFMSFERQDCLNFIKQVDEISFEFSVVKAKINIYNEEQYQNIM